LAPKPSAISAVPIISRKPRANITIVGLALMKFARVGLRQAEPRCRNGPRHSWLSSARRDGEVGTSCRLRMRRGHGSVRYMPAQALRRLAPGNIKREGFFGARSAIRVGRLVGKFELAKLRLTLSVGAWSSRS
jgi:hypothetical protein